MGIEHIPVDAGREPETPAGVAGPLPGPESSPGRWHSVTVSASQPHAAPDNPDLERSFQELVRYYRHSSVGSRCLGIVHRMNTPLQVLSFQLDLLEQKAQEELGLLTASPLADTDRLGDPEPLPSGEIQPITPRTQPAARHEPEPGAARVA